jgi:hypothetical protein
VFISFSHDEEREPFFLSMITVKKGGSQIAMSTETTITRPMVSTDREHLLRTTNPAFNEHELFSSTMIDETPAPLSETVTNLASNVYRELERIIRNFGESSVKDLMPVMISILGQYALFTFSVST